MIDCVISIKYLNHWQSVVPQHVEYYQNEYHKRMTLISNYNNLTLVVPRGTGAGPTYSSFCKGSRVLKLYPDIIIGMINSIE